MALQQSSSLAPLGYDAMQQMAYGQNTSNSKHRGQMYPTNLNHVFQSIDQPSESRLMNMSNLAASYCGPFLNTGLDQSLYQLELESCLVKDKVEILEQSLRDEKAKRQSAEAAHKTELEQSRAQVQELMRQIEKSARDYKKLLG